MQRLKEVLSSKKFTAAPRKVTVQPHKSLDDLPRILTKDCDTGLTVSAIATDNRCKADLCSTDEGNTVFFDQGNKDSVFGASKDFSSRLSASLDVNDTNKSVSCASRS